MDVIALRQFYETPLGITARRLVREVFSFMPARQGVIHWPADGPSASALVEETALPLADGVVDLVLLIHGLELAEHLSGLLSEVWRVLAPQGRLLAVVSATAGPSRAASWRRCWRRRISGRSGTCRRWGR